MTHTFRTESDFLGEMRLPDTAGWGIATARAAQNSGLGFTTLGESESLLGGLLIVKRAAALANRDLGTFDPRIAQEIADAAAELVEAPDPTEFPLEVVQGGGGTSLNMNVNEVLARRATERLRAQGIDATAHPLDHVNRCQSTNDVFPTAAGIAALAAIDRLAPALEGVVGALEQLSRRYEGVQRLGRSCLMDAVPLPIAAGHRAHASALRQRISALLQSRTPLLQVPLGGTAVGTGIGAVPGFDAVSVDHLAALTGLAFAPADDRFDAIASLEPVAQVMGAIESSARVLGRIAGDLRLLAAGPRGGAGEVLLPAVQAGSSIMPGKINPVIPELVLQTSFRISGAAHTVALAASTAELDVTPMGPIVMEEILGAAGMLERAAHLFTSRCLDGVEWDLERVQSNLAGSFESAVEYAAANGYEAAAAARTTSITKGTR